MQQTIEPTLEVAASAAKHIETFSERAIHLMSFVPDDKLTWTPSPTGKSFLRVSVHFALVNRFFANIISGGMPEPMPTPEQFFGGLAEGETKITSREGAMALVKESSAELCNALRRVNAGNIESSPNSPFGPIPMAFWLGECQDHAVRHVGQLEYLQTIWGDLDNHLG